MTSSFVYSILVAVLFVGFLSSAPSKNGSTRTRNNTKKWATQVPTISTTTTAPVKSDESELSCEMKYDKFDESIVIQQGIQDLMGQYNNWGTLLAPAPMAIGILSQLILMANQRMDFPINSGDPQKVFKHIEYPNSFRTTLLQISQRGHRAFLKAHINMDIIRNINSFVPHVIKDAVRYLMSKNVQIIKLRLPYTLGKINEAAMRSQNLSKEVVQEFNLTLSLIEETELAVSTTIGVPENRLINTTFEINLENQAKELSEQEESILQKKDAKLKAMLKKFKHNTGHLYYLNRNNDIDESIYYRNFFKSNVCAQKNSQQLLDLLILLGEYRERYEHWQKSNNQRNSIFDGTKVISDFEHALENLHQECPEVNGILTKGFVLLNKFKSSTTFNSTNKATKRPCSDEITQIVILIKNLRKAANEVIEESGKQEEVIVKNSLDIFSISEPYRQLISMSKTIEDIIKLNNNLTEVRRQKTRLILDRITNLDINKVNVGQVVLTLKSSLVELSKMRDDWAKLVAFFENIYNFVLVASRYSSGLVEIVETLSDYPEEIFKEQILFNELMECVEKSNQAVLLVRGIANMYTNVSNDHIMGRVARLNTLHSMMIDGITDKQLQEEKEKLSNDSLKASKGIEDLFIKKANKLNRTLKDRHQEILAEYIQLFDCLNKTSLLDSINFSGDNWFQLESGMNGKVLEVSSGNHSVVQMWDSHGKDNQLWYLDANQIIRSFATDGCLTSHGNPRMVNVEPCKDTTNQKWKLNNSTIVNAGTNRCLDIKDADKLNGARIVEYECHGRANQQWNIKYQ